MPKSRPLTILCLASYEKGTAFMRECKRQGCRVLLLTVEKLARRRLAARRASTRCFCMPDLADSART